MPCVRRILFIELLDQFLDFVERRLIGGLLLGRVFRRCFAEFDIGRGARQIALQERLVFLAGLGLVVFDRFAELIDGALVVFTAHVEHAEREIRFVIVGIQFDRFCTSSIACLFLKTAALAVPRKRYASAFFGSIVIARVSGEMASSPRPSRTSDLP